LLWVQTFRIFIGAQNKLTHLLQSPPAVTDPTYVTWLTRDYFVMTWSSTVWKRRLVALLYF